MLTNAQSLPKQARAIPPPAGPSTDWAHCVRGACRVHGGSLVCSVISAGAKPACHVATVRWLRAAFPLPLALPMPGACESMRGHSVSSMVAE